MRSANPITMRFWSGTRPFSSKRAGHLLPIVGDFLFFIGVDSDPKLCKPDTHVGFQFSHLMDSYG